MSTENQLPLTEGEQRQWQIEEAVANGANRFLATLAAEAGVDPRKVRELYE